MRSEGISEPSTILYGLPAGTSLAANSSRVLFQFGDGVKTITPPSLFGYIILFMLYYDENIATDTYTLSVAVLAFVFVLTLTLDVDGSFGPSRIV